MNCIKSYMSNKTVRCRLQSKIPLRDLDFAKISTMLLKSSCRTTSFSIAINDKWFKRWSDIDVRSSFLILPRAEKERSPEQFDTKRVRYMRSAMWTLGNASRTPGDETSRYNWSSKLDVSSFCFIPELIRAKSEKWTSSSASPQSRSSGYASARRFELVRMDSGSKSRSLWKKPKTVSLPRTR